MIITAIFLVVAYLVGSLSSAVIVCKFMKLPDPRTEGSKNPGATNVLRIGGKEAALITLLGDVVKGLLPVVIADVVGVQGFALALVAVAAFVGHLFPVFFEFKGGKGVATAFGGVLALSWGVGIAALVTWLAVAAIFRYSSLAALVAALLTPIYFAIFTSNYSYIFPVALMVAALVWRHWANIEKLRAGTEDKIQLEMWKK